MPQRKATCCGAHGSSTTIPGCARIRPAAYLPVAAECEAAGGLYHAIYSGGLGWEALPEPEEQDPERTRFPRAEQLVTGDVLVYAGAPGFAECGVSLFTGDTLWDMQGEPETAAAGLERVLSYHRFLILRPSMRQ